MSVICLQILWCEEFFKLFENVAFGSRKLCLTFNINQFIVKKKQQKNPQIYQLWQ